MDFNLKKQLGGLELSDLARIVEAHEMDITMTDLSFDERLTMILTTLVQERENKLVARLIRHAHLKYPTASIETMDYDARDISKEKMLNLASMCFIETTTNIIITGPTGSGKTYLSCALGIEACKQKYRTLYIRMPDLLRNFENLRDNLRELTKYRKRIGNYPLLIIDEWLNSKVNDKDLKMLYELFEQRAGNHSTIFVGQYTVDTWHERLGGATQADSIMDRIIHNSYPITSNETNLRKIYDNQRLKRLVNILGE